jgi:poly-gamma-glutamate capsule biosynthesis protein CapA/YwtB (metallophosphatase superfamily)
MDDHALAALGMPQQTERCQFHMQSHGATRLGFLDSTLEVSKERSSRQSRLIFVRTQIDPKMRRGNMRQTILGSLGARACQRRFIFPAALALSATMIAGPVLAQTALVFAAPKSRRDPAAELKMKINEPFTVVTVGDLIQVQPFSRSDDPDIKDMVDIMRKADVTMANNENNIVDHDTFRGTISHMEASATVADDWANMGIDIVTKANNHTFDDGEEGLWADFQELRRVGIEHVGADRNETEARMARFVATPKGTVGLIGAYAKSIDGRQLYGLPAEEPVFVTPDQFRQLRAMRDSILARRKETPYPVETPKDTAGEILVYGVTFKQGKPGDATAGDAAANDLKAKMKQAESRHSKIDSKINDLPLTTYNGVTQNQMGQLRAIAGDSGTGDSLSAFGVKFKVMPAPGEYYYEMDPQKLQNILREVRTESQFFDFAAVTIHWHQNRFAFQAYSFDNFPSEFEVKFAHAVIDQGAQLFFAHGVHTIRGIEIYKGKPIFYGQSNFVFQQQTFRSWRDFGDQPPASLTEPLVGEGEENELKWNWLEQSANLQALMISTTYDKGKLKEVRIYPIDLGLHDRPWSQLGTPKLARGEVARKILEELAGYSQPFSTKILIENGVGIIRMP